jgi:3-methyladenine DNA glycosylase AlkD
MTIKRQKFQPMTTSEITEAIRSDLEYYAEPERREMIAANHPTTLMVLGLKAAELRKVINEWRKKLSCFTEEQWIELSIKLVNSEIHECQLTAFEFLWKNKKALQALSVDQIFALGKNLDNWASVDSYCLYITGYSWRIGNLQDSNIEQWAMSENRWIRRTALVSTVPLNLRARGGKGDVERTLAICKMLVSDYDDMVIKAMSWALRELSKTDKQAVIEFLDENTSVLHSKVKREVNTKLTTGKKNGMPHKIN